MTNPNNHISLRKAAIITGLALLTSVIAAPFAELYVFPKLVIPYNPAETAKNILANQTLFIAAIFSYLITFIADIVLTWSLYILLVPVNKSLSLFAACLRLVYTLIALVALNNVVTAFRLYTTPEYLNMFQR